MSSLWNFIAFTILLSYSINGVLGLKCYHCVDSNGGNPICRKNVANIHIEDCNQTVYENGTKNWNCMIILSKDRNSETFSRLCAPSGKGQPCEQKRTSSENGDLKTFVECCNTDLCNSSYKINAGLFILSVCLVFITLFWK